MIEEKETLMTILAAIASVSGLVLLVAKIKERSLTIKANLLLKKVELKDNKLKEVVSHTDNKDSVAFKKIVKNVNKKEKTLLQLVIKYMLTNDKQVETEINKELDSLHKLHNQTRKSKEEHSAEFYDAVEESYDITLKNVESVMRTATDKKPIKKSPEAISNLKRILEDAEKQLTGDR